MNSKILLKISAALIIIHLLGHTMGHLSWDKPEDAGMAKVVEAMKSCKAEFMGASKAWPIIMWVTA